MKHRFFSTKVFVGALLSIGLSAPVIAEEPSAAQVPVPAVAPTPAAGSVAATPNVADGPNAGEEVDLLKIFPVQEPLRPQTSESPDEATIAAKAEAGEVWVNEKSKIYHKAGTTYYGKTKKGFFLPEAEAIEKGYRGVRD